MPGKQRKRSFLAPQAPRSEAERQTIVLNFLMNLSCQLVFFPSPDVRSPEWLRPSAYVPQLNRQESPIDVMLKTKAKVQFDREVTERDVTVPHFEPLSIRRNLSSFCKFANLEVDDFRFINDFG